MSDGRSGFQLREQPLFDIRRVLGGFVALAVVGTLVYLIWRDATGRLVSYGYLLIFLVYLPPAYLVLYAMAPGDATGTIALVDRLLATLTAAGLLAPWCWFITVPPSPQNSLAPAGLFMLGWMGAAALYGSFKIIVYEIRRRRDS
jgi:hypothetical protein